MVNVDGTKLKRVTINFERFRTFSEDDTKEFNKWRQEMQDKRIPVGYDHRNNIYCVQPTMDYEMYYNYLNYLNQESDKWLHSGYLDAGMVPYLMWPSFMDSSSYLESMKRVASQAGIDIIKVPSVSLLKPSYVSNGTDYWVFREDLWKLAEIMEKKNPGLQFGFSKIEDVNISNYIKELIRFTRQGTV